MAPASARAERRMGAVDDAAGVGIVAAPEGQRRGGKDRATAAPATRKVPGRLIGQSA